MVTSTETGFAGCECVRLENEALAGIYSWFPEGFDTVDLVGANARLEELA